jgi:hypothetical protein
MPLIMSCGRGLARCVGRIEGVNGGETFAILTVCLATSRGDIEQFLKYVGLAEARCVPLVVVNALCDVGTNSARLCSEDRKRIGKDEVGEYRRP